MTAALSLRQIKKSYGAVEALKGVDLDVPQGKVMAICGDNGAGKSTLIRIISGAQEPSAGALSLNGKPVVFGSPHDALVQGIATIYQDLALAPRLSIWENIFMGAELVRRVGPFSVLDKRRMAQDARGYLQRLSVPIDDMDRPVERMSGGQRQAVAIGRAVAWANKVIILDEPTNHLGAKQSAEVLEIIRQARAKGLGVVFISHTLPHVLEVTDRIVVLRLGKVVANAPTSTFTPDSLLKAITGLA